MNCDTQGAGGSEAQAAAHPVPGPDGSVRKPYGIFAAAFLIDLAVACLMLSLQFLAVSMGAIPRVLGMIGAFGSGGYAATCVFSGGIADRIGRKRSATIGIFSAAVVWLLYTKAPNPYWLLAMVPFGGAALGMVWPAVQAWLAERTASGQRALNRNLGLFNVSWSAGLLIGPLVAGYIWRDDFPALPFVLCAATGGVVVIVLLLTPGGGPGVRQQRQSATDDADGAQDHALWPLFMKLAWAGNFSSWFVGATIQTMFPKLGLSAEMALSHRLVGVVIFCYWGALMGSFFLARTTQRWQFKMWPLIVAEAFSLLGMLCAGLYANSAVAFGICFAIAGGAAGVTYVSSLFYSITGSPESCGRRTGFHEAILGVGSLAGGLISGEVATMFGLRTPYLAAASIIFAVVLVQVLVWTSRTRATRLGHQATV